ncbi:MAG: BtpA/SgcQ family protein [Candidatus Lokiarchaeota archaeon]|nr:BtpA/SgcQ family protein [Candidatus Lokiarchaeota archaeon]
MLAEIFSQKKPIIGVVHLPALPGSPHHSKNLDEISKFAITDARSLEEGGCDGIIIENYFDQPFLEKMAVETVASMTKIACEIKQNVSLPLGINALRNDPFAGLAISQAIGGKFIRVNVFVGAAVVGPGIVHGCAAELLRYRSKLDCDVKIFADIDVKHATPLVKVPIEREAREAAYRGKADGLIVTSHETGSPPQLETVQRVKNAVSDVPIIIGSGISSKTVEELLEVADGAIVGSSLKQRIDRPIDINLVRTLVDAVMPLRRD